MKCVLDKAYIKGNFGKGSGRTEKNAYVFLENIKVILKRMLVEIWTVKAMDGVS